MSWTLKSHTKSWIFTVENLKCNFSALHSTSTDFNEWINSLLTLAQMARLHDPGNNQMLAEQKWKINSNWLLKLRISGYSGRIYSKPSPSRSTLWIYLICKLSPILHPTQLICNQYCYLKCRHLICWRILHSSCNFFFFAHVYISVHLLHSIFILLNSEPSSFFFFF